MRTWAIVVAAGGGARFGGLKQLEVLGDRRVVDWAVGAARAACDGVVVVAPRGVDLALDEVRVVAGGETRSASVRAGLAAVPDDADVIVVHDAARPLAPAALFAAVVAAVADGADAAVPAVAVADTLKEVDGAKVLQTIPRHRVVAAQTPQAFRAGAIRDAHSAGGDATDDAALVERSGGSVVVVPGDERAMKVTAASDLHVLRSLLDD